jgi:uncharacterized membrane protein HdeD (DUF308 family)
MSPIAYPMADAFLLGFIAAISLVAALFFLRFWRDTRDPLFVAFAAFFALQGGIDAILLDMARPKEGNVWMILLRLSAIVVVAGAVLRKNMGKS